MSMIRIASLALALVLCAPSAFAKVTAIQAAPIETDFAFIIHGLGQLEPMLNEHMDTMKRYGLETPDIAPYLQDLREALKVRKKTRGPLVPTMGLSEEGSIALYAQQAPVSADSPSGNEPHIVFVADVKERKALIQTMENMFLLLANSDKLKRKIKKERLPGKGLLVSFHEADSDKVGYLRFQGDLAAFSNSLEAIESVQFAGGKPFLGSDVLSSARIGGFVGLRTAGAMAMKMLPAQAGSVKTAQIFGLLRANQFEGKLDIEFEPEFESILSVMRPGANGKASRAAMSKLVTKRTDMWWRSSLDLLALENLGISLFGQAWDKAAKKFEHKTGLAQSLIAKSITGDQLVRCDGSFSTCVLAAGVLDAEGAERLIRTFFAIAGDLSAKNSAQEVSVETKALSGTGESRRMVTTVSIREDLEKKAELLKRAHEYLRYEEENNALQVKLQEAYGDDPDLADVLETELNELNEKHTKTGLVNYRWEHPERIHDAREIEREAKASKGKKRRAKKKKKKEPFQPILTIHWGMTDKMVVFGTTPHAVNLALKASDATAAPAASPVLDDLTFMAGYQARGGLADLIRQAIPFLRSLMPKEFIGGAIIRAIDGLVVLHDESVDGTTYMRVSPTHLTIHGVSTSLPMTGQSDYSAELSDAYTSAMRERYAGDLAKSNELLAKLAMAHPATPWGVKAAGMVFRSDLASAFTNLGYLSTLSSLVGSTPQGRSMIRELEQLF